MDKEEILDEISDMCWGIGRLIGGLVGKEYSDTRGYKSDRGYYVVLDSIQIQNNSIGDKKHVCCIS